MLRKQLSDFEARPEVPLNKGPEVCCLAIDKRGGGDKLRSDFCVRPKVPLGKGPEVCCLAINKREGGRKKRFGF